MECDSSHETGQNIRREIIMRFVIQRVKHASVTIDNKVNGAIEKGYLIFVGVSDTDDEAIADNMVRKTAGLRIFEDENGKTNLSLNDVGGDILAVSQFTLYADCKKGNRPSFNKAGKPEHANKLYEYVVERFRKEYGFHVETGIFGADMKVELLNDGPFTILLDSDEL